LLPVVLSTMPGFEPPFEEILWKVSPLAPMVVLVTLRAEPVVESIVLLEPVTLTATAPLMALKPVPEVVSIFSPPFEKVIVALSLLSSVTAVLVPVLRFLVPLLKLMVVVVPLVLFCTLMPVHPDEQFRLPVM